MKAFTQFWCWLKWKMGLRPAWVKLPLLDPWSADSHGEHRMEAVSRHAIAEMGLVCPRCLNEVCFRGDYTKVREGQVGKYKNEVILCDGTRALNGQDVPCGGILMASPDTEHGDNLLWDNVPADQREALFFRFRRITEEQMLKEKYGFDITNTKGYLEANPAEAKGGKLATLPVLWDYEMDGVYELSNGLCGHVTEVMKEHDGDKFYVGWCVMEIDGDGVRWFVNPHGVVRRDMTDPTLNNLKVVAKQRKV